MAENTGLVTEAGQKVDVLGDGKLIKTCVTPGTGIATPRDGANVWLHYVGTLKTGSQFDSSRDRDEPITFPTGQKQVIKGWEHGIPTMRKGERSVFEIHHSLAYGEEGRAPTIPPAATLVFDVELLSWSNYADMSGEKKDGKYMKDSLRNPAMWDTKPAYEAVCDFTIHYLKELPADYAVEEEAGGVDAVLREVEAPLKPHMKVTVGDEEVCPELEYLIQNMNAAELSRVITHLGDWSAYGGPNLTEANAGVKDDKDKKRVQVLLEMHEYKNPKMLHEVKSVADKVHEGEARKAEGNALYKQKKFKRAAKKYEAALSYLEQSEDYRVREVRLPLFTNLAAVQLEMGENVQAAASCTKALDLDPSNIRALTRRAKANRIRCDFNKVRADCELILDLEPKNKDAVRELELIEKILADQKKKEKAVFSGMFDKLSKKSKAEPAKDEEMPEEKEDEKEKEIPFKDNVPRVVHVTACSQEDDDTPPICGGYRVNTRRLHNKSPFWENTSANPQSAQWRIFSDPHGRWKLGLAENMADGVGYVKAKDPHNFSTMPHETKEWVMVGDEGDWEADTVTQVSLEPRNVGPEQAA